jgi:hypothetical protein
MFELETECDYWKNSAVATVGLNMEFQSEWIFELVSDIFYRGG